jgi:hypothetical protein
MEYEVMSRDKHPYASTWRNVMTSHLTAPSDVVAGHSWLDNAFHGSSNGRCALFFPWISH